MIFRASKTERKNELNRSQNRLMRERRSDVRDIGEIPPVVNYRRKQRCSRNLKLFLQTYLKASFPSPWGKCHLRAIRKLESCLLNNGLFSEAMPRGSGKTTIAEGGLIWATSYGHRHYCIFFAANKEKADAGLQSIKSEFENNDLLQEDFPEICYPVAKLEGIALRAAGQLHKGVSTQIRWGRKLVFPTIPGSACSGTIIEAVGITGSFKGKKHKLLDGTSERPDFALIDDPQDREDAESQTETNKREKIIQGDILGLAGHKRKIASVCLITPIQKDDLAARLLSHKRHPEWQGETTPMIIKYPAAKESLWVQYFILRREGLADGDEGAAANAFYRKNRKAMDKDAEVSWPARHGKGESAIQYAMNLLCDLGEEAFASEYQCEPLDNVVNMTRLEDETVLSRIGILLKHEIPADAAFLVAGIDINLYGLTFCVTAFRNDWTASIVDYGLTSDGGRQRNEMTDAQYVATLLKVTLDEFDARPYSEKLNGVLIDRGYMADAVKSVLKATKKRYSLAASLGRSTKEYKPPKDARRAGNGWYEKDMDGVLTIVHNSDIYRVQAQRAFLLSVGAQAGASLWKDSPRQHRPFAQQMCNEFLCGVDDQGRHDWRQKPGSRHDILDGVVMTYAGAAVMGCGSVQRVRQQTKPNTPIEATYSEI